MPVLTNSLADCNTALEGGQPTLIDDALTCLGEALRSS
jgi:hypothetical protein